MIDWFLQSGVMRKIAAILFISFFIPLISCVFFLQAGQPDESSCVKCHTNEQVLKSLHKPPKVEVSEGEG